MDDREAARQKSSLVVERLRSLGLEAAAKCFVESGVEETLSYMAFPSEHWLSLRSNNMLERAMKEIRRRTRVVGAFPDGNSTQMLVAARLRHIAGTQWGSRRYLDMNRLHNNTNEKIKSLFGCAHCQTNLKPEPNWIFKCAQLVGHYQVGLWLRNSYIGS